MTKITADNLTFTEKVIRTYLYFNHWDVYFLEDGRWYEESEDCQLVQHEPTILALNKVYLENV